MRFQKEVFIQTVVHEAESRFNKAIFRYGSVKHKRSDSFDRSVGMRSEPEYKFF